MLSPSILYVQQVSSPAAKAAGGTSQENHYTREGGDWFWKGFGKFGDSFRTKVDSFSKRMDSFLWNERV